MGLCAGKYNSETERLDFRRHREFLRSHLVADSGLADKLFQRKMITAEELIEINRAQNYFKQNDCLIGFLTKRFKRMTLEDYETFLNLLRETAQSHIAYYLENNGEVDLDYLDRPLNEAERCLIQANYASLVDLLEPKEVMIYMLERRSITSNQRADLENRSSNQISAANNDLIGLVLRGSFANYKFFIECLLRTGQERVANPLRKKGVTASGHVTLTSGRNEIDEVEVVGKLNDILRSFSGGGPISEAVRAELQQLSRSGIEIVGVKRTNSTMWYFWCQSRESLDLLEQMKKVGRLREVIVRSLCHASGKDSSRFMVKVEVDREDVRSGQTYFLTKDMLAQLSSDGGNVVRYQRSQTIHREVYQIEQHFMKRTQRIQQIRKEN